MNFTTDWDILWVKGVEQYAKYQTYFRFAKLQRLLHDVAVGAPVFLTKNGRGRYVILDMQDFEKTQATLRLMNELAKGRKSGEEKGWLTLEAVEKNLGIVNE